MWSTIKRQGIDLYTSCLFLGGACTSLCSMALSHFDHACNLEQALYGCISACLGLISLHAIFGQYGASQPVITALLISSACGILAGVWLSKNLVYVVKTSARTWPFINLIILWIIALIVTNISGLSQLSSLLMSNLPAHFLSNTWGMALGLMIPCLLCWALPLTLLVMEHAHLNEPVQLARTGWCGLACLLIPVTLFPCLGLLNTAYCTLVLTSLLVVHRVYLFWLKPAVIPVTKSQQASASISSNGQYSLFTYQQIMVLAGLIGVMTAAVRYYSNLILASEILVYAELGFSIIGCALGMTFFVKQQTSSRSPTSSTILSLAGPGLPGFMLIMFPLLTLGLLWSTTYLQFLSLIILSKFLAVMIFYLPAGLLCGFYLKGILSVSNLGQQGSATTFFKGLITTLCCASLSIWITRFVLIGNIGVAKTFIFWSAWMMIWNLQILSELFSNLWLKVLQDGDVLKSKRKTIIGPRVKLGFAWSIVAIVLLQPYTQSYYQPEISAQLLFSGNSFGAFREKIAPRDIPQVEGRRTLLQAEGALSTLVAFTHRNAQLHLRKSGTPSSIISRDPEICPHFSGDMLSIILPLVIHEAPRNVCVLGAAGGASAKVVSAWPLHEATIIDPELAFIQKLGKQDIIPWYQPCTQQANLKFNACDLPLAYCSMPKEQDVIVLNTDLSALAATAPCFAETYLQRVKSHLSTNGIFALRFNYTDYGQRPLLDMAKTFCKLYQDTLMFETAPGEMVFIGSQWKDQLTSSVIIQNLQTPQARRLIAEIGWDWSIVLNLSLYDHAKILELAAHDNKSITQDNLAFQHPLELYGWHNKHQEISQLLDSKSNRLIAIHEQHPLKEDILYRLSDIAAREKLLYDHPDEPWAYRKFAKDRLQNHTRSEIITVKGEGLQKKIHADDQRRLDYFESLGQLVQKTNPALGDIRTLYKYNEPYDPVISYFMHNEVARICARLEPQERVEELRCRMHMIYFGSLNDRSVIDICKCLTLLTELLPGEITPAQRWDYANGLCEQLKIRWRARASGASVPPVIEISDLKESITAVRGVADQFPAWGQAAGIDQQIIDSRTRMVEKLLISSLQDYKIDRLKKLEVARQSTNTTKTEKDKEPSIFGF